MKNKNTNLILCLFVLSLIVTFAIVPFKTKAAGNDTTWQKDYSYTVDNSAMEIKITKYNGRATVVNVPQVCIIGKNTYSVVMSGSVFKGCKTIKKLTVEKGVMARGKCKGMFEKCTSLNTLDLSNLDTDEVTEMSGFLYGDYNLKIADLSNFSLSSLKGITKNKKYIVDKTFTGELYLPRCLKNLEPWKFGLLQLKTAKLHFYGTEEEWIQLYGDQPCSDKLTVYFEDTGKKHTGTFFKKKGETFTYKGLNYKFITMKKIGDDTYPVVECVGTSNKKLNKVYLQKTVLDENEYEYYVYGIGKDAFKNNKSIKELVIDNYHTDHKNPFIIRERAFMGCSNLNKVSYVQKVKIKFWHGSQSIRAYKDSFKGTKKGIELTVFQDKYKSQKEFAKQKKGDREMYDIYYYAFTLTGLDEPGMNSPKLVIKRMKKMNEEDE